MLFLSSSDEEVVEDGSKLLIVAELLIQGRAEVMLKWCGGTAELFDVGLVEVGVEGAGCWPDDV